MEEEGRDGTANTCTAIVAVAASDVTSKTPPRSPNTCTAIVAVAASDVTSKTPLRPPNTCTAIVAVAASDVTSKTPPRPPNTCTAIVAVASDVTSKTPLRPPAGKKRGTLSLIRAAFLMVRGRSSCKRKSVIVEAPSSPSVAEGGWKTLVGGMRPFHVPQLEYYPSNPLLLPPPPPAGHESYHDVSLPPASPASPARSNSSGGMSRYASAEDLQALDGNDDDENGDAVTDDGSGGPNAIDAQAEEFIAKFYEQMRLQRLESFNCNTI